MEESKQTASESTEKEFQQAIDKYISNGGRLLAIFGGDGGENCQIQGNKSQFVKSIRDYMLQDVEFKSIIVEACFSTYIEEKKNDIQIHNQRSIKN